MENGEQGGALHLYLSSLFEQLLLSSLKGRLKSMSCGGGEKKRPIPSSLCFPLPLGLMGPSPPLLSSSLPSPHPYTGGFPFSCL